jgi:hypothetical protein
MKIYDIVSEAPVGAFDRAKQSVGGVFSKDQKRKGEVSKEANEVAAQLKSRLKGAGVDINNIPIDTFLQVLNQTGYGDGAKDLVDKFQKDNDPNATLNKKQAEQIILKQVQSASLSSQGSGIKKGKFAGGADNKNSNSQATFKQAAKAAGKGFKKGWQGDKSKTKKTPSPNKKAPSKDKDIEKIAQALKGLSDQEKKQLGKLI